MCLVYFDIESSGLPSDPGFPRICEMTMIGIKTSDLGGNIINDILNEFTMIFDTFKRCL